VSESGDDSIFVSRHLVINLFLNDLYLLDKRFLNNLRSCSFTTLLSNFFPLMTLLKLLICYKLSLSHGWS